MNNKIETIIDLFIKSIKKEVDAKFECVYEYNLDENLYSIWHNYSDFNNVEFKKIIGKNVRNYFYENNIFNISLSYSVEKTKEINKAYTTLQYTEIKPYYAGISIPKQVYSQSYNINLSSQLENLKQTFSINIPKQECIIINKVDTHVGKEMLEVPAA